MNRQLKRGMHESINAEDARKDRELWVVTIGMIVLHIVLAFVLF